MSKAIWWGALFSLVLGGLLLWALAQEPEGVPIPRPGVFPAADAAVVGPDADVVDQSPVYSGSPGRR